MTLTAGSRVQLTETGGTIERIHADRGTAEILWDTGARSCDPLDWLTSEGTAQPNPPEPSAAERKEDALYKCAFDAGHQDKRNPKLLNSEFGLPMNRARELVERLAAHEGNARCGILSRSLPGYSISRVQRMVSDAAERDSWRIGGMEPPAHLSPSDPPSKSPGVMTPAEKVTPLIAGVLDPKIAPYRDPGQGPVRADEACAAGSHCARPGEPLEASRRGTARYHYGCKQRAKRARRQVRV
jgi:hypothetical protein